LIKIIVSHTTSYIEFQLSTSSHTKWPSFWPTFWAEPFDVVLNKNNMQTIPYRSLFSPTLRFLH